MRPSDFSIISPFLRGMSAKEGTGLLMRHVRSRELYRKLRDSYAAVWVPDSAEEILTEQVIRIVKDFIEKKGGFPGAVLLGNEDIYLSGDNYDELEEIKSGTRKTLQLIQTGEGDPRSRYSAVKDKICLITGAAQGFGEGIARDLAARGAFVAIADLNIEGARQVSSDLNGKYGKTVSAAYHINVTDEESVSGAVKNLVAEVGGVDLLVSNAGVLKAGSVKKLSFKDFQFVTGVNYSGFFLCTKYSSPIMAEQNKGFSAAAGKSYFSDIIQINSKSGLEGSNRNGAYAGSKFGGLGLVQSFALELVEDNIKVNAVCPGNFFEGPLWSDPEKGLFRQYLDAGKVEGAKSIADVKTYYESKVPMNRGCSVKDVMTAILYLVEQQYETGQALPVTGGQVMLN
jgi:sorbitol-6-phosphate 2-dehydrogenase